MHCHPSDNNNSFREMPLNILSVSDVITFAAACKLALWLFHVH